MVIIIDLWKSFDVIQIYSVNLFRDAKFKRKSPHQWAQLYACSSSRWWPPARFELWFLPQSGWMGRSKRHLLSCQKPLVINSICSIWSLLLSIVSPYHELPPILGWRQGEGRGNRNPWRLMGKIGGGQLYLQNLLRSYPQKEKMLKYHPNVASNFFATWLPLDEPQHFPQVPCPITNLIRLNNSIGFFISFLNGIS